jgi:hypothetical protein
MTNRLEVQSVEDLELGKLLVLNWSKLTIGSRLHSFRTMPPEVAEAAEDEDDRSDEVPFLA